MTNVNFKMFFDRQGVAKRVDRKQRTVLVRTGGYTRTVMRNSMKKAGKDKSAVIRVVDDDGNEVFIDDKGRVRNGNGRYLPKAHAARVRARAAKAQTKAQRVSGGSKPGQPPRYRKGDLRKIYFGYDDRRKSVVTGPTVYRTKTRPAGGKTTAELINEGGAAQIATPAGVTKATFQPRPFTPPAFDAGQKKYLELTASTPL